jgi:NADP-dependent 3-hydroxy acid dehydrogenase YdfG
MANALIVGAGSGISAAVAHRLARSGYSVALAARRPEALASLAKEIGAHVVACDAAVREDVDQLFAGLRERWQQLDVVLYNAGYRMVGFSACPQCGLGGCSFVCRNWVCNPLSDRPNCSRT